MKLHKNVTQITIFAIGWTLLFLLVSTALRSISSSTVAVISLIAASASMTAYGLRRGYKTFRNEIDAFGAQLKTNKDYALFATFTAGLFAAFVFQVVNRYSSGPSGADTIFFLVTAPLFAFLFGFINKEKTSWAGAIGVFTALAGAIFVLANWERPSSFSPFAIFPTEELLLLISASGLALFAAVGKRLIERYNPEIMMTVALWAVTLIMVVATWPSRVLFSLGTISSESWVVLLMIGVLGLAVPLLSLLKAVKTAPVLQAVSAIALMPVLVTSLIVAEKLSGFASLATPFAVPPVLAGSAITILGVTAIWLTQKNSSPALEGRGLGGGWNTKAASGTPTLNSSPLKGEERLLKSLLLVLALAQTAWSIVALFFSVESTAITGQLTSGAPYHAVISTPGYNTVAGMMMVLAGVAATFAAWDLYSKKATPAKTAVWAGFSAVLAASTFLSGKANIVSWLSSIPAEIQHAMGSEYVTVTESAVTNIPLLIAYGFTAAFVLLALLLFLSSRTYVRDLNASGT